MATGNDKRRPVLIVDGSRTPFLKARGRPGPFSAVDLAVAAGRPLLLRQPFPPDAFDEVILGCGAPPAEATNPSRVAALRLRMGDGMPGWTVQRNCGSGMQSIDTAWRYIADGHAELILAGGTEALSHVPLLVNRQMMDWLADWNKASSPAQRARLLARLRPAHFAPVIGLAKGLSDPVAELSMGETAEVLAHEFNISREAMDRYALASHHRLARAQDEDYLEEVEAIYDREGHIYKHDDGVRRDTDMDQLAKLKPVFEKPYGKVTAGNSSQVTDGAAWLILASEPAAEKYGLEVLGRIVDSHWAALDPARMGLGPVLAATPLLKRHALSLESIDVWELNEAFAAQVLACLEAWADEAYCRERLGLEGALGEIDHARLNVDGGAISLGHPVGTSGTRIVLHLLHVLKRTGGRLGIATECIGGGQGGAMLLARA